jgi:hypothetical protein
MALLLFAVKKGKVRKKRATAARKRSRAARNINHGFCSLCFTGLFVIHLLVLLVSQAIAGVKNINVNVVVVRWRYLDRRVPLEKNEMLC